MDIDRPTKITSFVIRFVQTDSGTKKPSLPNYRGTVRHIQSDQEINFTHWQEVTDFINRFILIDESGRQSHEQP